MAEQQQPKSADKYYKGKIVSAIDNAHSPQRKGNLNTPRRALTTQPVAKDKNSAERYYRDTTKQAANPMPPRPDPDSKARPKPGKAYEGLEANVVRPILVKRREDIATAGDAIVEALSGSQKVVLVQSADADLDKRIRLAMDLRTAREEITQERRRDIRFSLMPKSVAEIAEQAAGKLNIAAIPAAVEDDEPLPDDFEAFVKGSSDAEPVVKEGATAETQSAQVIETPVDPLAGLDDTGTLDRDNVGPKGEAGEPGLDTVTDDMPVPPDDSDED